METQDTSLTNVMRLAMQHHQAGNLSQAEQLYQQVLALDSDHAQANHYLGIIAHQTGNHETAVQLLQRAVRSSPNHAELYNNLGNMLQATGCRHEAIDSFTQAVTLKPEYAEAHFNLGHVLKAVGRLDEAEASYHKALNLKPDWAEGYCHLANVFREQGRTDEAIAGYTRALALKPDLAIAHNNLGTVFQAAGRLDEAINSYTKALSLRPDDAEAHNNLGTAFETTGQIDNARDSVLRSLSLRPEYTDAIRNFAKLMRTKDFAPRQIACDIDLKRLLVTCLNRDDIDPQDLFHAGLGLLLNAFTLQAIESYLDKQPEQRDFDALRDNTALWQLLQDELFLLLLKRTVVVDPRMERFLTEVRKSITLSVAGVRIDHSVLSDIQPFIFALAGQCFWNEYIFVQTPAEQQAVEHIITQTQERMSSKDKNFPFYVALLSCFAPLGSYDRILTGLTDDDLVSDHDLADLWEIQIEQPQRERAIALEIECLTEIKDDVSQRVRSQYETNPYPRWIGMATNRPIPFVDYLREDIRPNTLRQLPALDHHQVLIAGCGTGSQPVSCAQAYKDTTILAIDLSLPSLAYAKRKAEEQSVTNVQFMQADILDLWMLDRQFDVIECMGVLHHMADPVHGWRTLLDLLKPNGFMKLGLYSEHAREAVVAARSLAQSKGYEPNPEGIRTCRQAILALPDQNPAKSVIGVPDFYTTSGVRDLLFHEQEHRFTLPDIAEILTELNLELLGFVIDSDVKAAYLNAYPEDALATSLTHWHQFELGHPETFWGMYKFWVKKK